jgi:UDP-N-acetylglucosamine--N-acetylmuramyl-(pentapeptide) pyrophosphoryl-undecaprenol N-acetylglucosamine transferase
MFAMPGRLAGAVHTTGQILERVGADVVVGFGGYVSAPAYLAAKRHHVPMVVHEANPSPGFANRLGAMLSPHVFTGQPETKLRNATCIGLPIRRTIADLDRFKLGDQARAHFRLRLDLPVLLVFGGSQGATSLNRALAGAVGPILNSGVQILHVTGPKNASDIQVPRGQVPYVAVPYVDQMDLAYAAADFALCRAGAMTCAELTAVGLPAVYVPLPHGNGEQRLNAQPIVAKGGGMMVDDTEMTASWIVNSLLPVLTNIDHVAAMSEAAAALGRRDADRVLAKAVIDIVAMEQAAAAAAAAARNAPPEAPDPLDEPVNLGQDAFGHSPRDGYPPQQYPQNQYPPQNYPSQNQYPPPQQQYPPQQQQYPPQQYPQGGRHRR